MLCGFAEVLRLGLEKEEQNLICHFSPPLLQPMQAARCPTDELSLTNCAVVNEKDFQSGQ